MPISADQWRAVTGLNNVRRPRQVGIKPRYMQQETCGDNDKLSHHPESDTTNDTTGGGARSKRSRIKKGSRRKDRSRRPERDKFQDDSTISIRTILWPSVLALCLAVIVPSLNLTVWGANVNDIFITPGAAAVIGDNSTIPEVFESSSVLGVQLLQSFISVVVMLLLLLSGDVETNPGPTTILSVNDHLRHVKRAVWEARTQWKNIGRSLRLSEGTIQSIHGADDGECLHIVLSIWMQTGRATINDLLDALEDVTVARHDIALNIRALKGKDRIKIGLEPQPQVEPIAISSIELSPKEGKIGVGKSARVTVEIAGTNPTYKWFRNDSEEPLTDSAVYKGTTTATLHIKEATTELSGNYWCEVSNEISPEEKSSSVHLDAIEKPVIVKKSEDRTVKLGGYVVLTVTAKGRDMEFNWVKHGYHPDDDITINPDNDQNYETEWQTDSDQNEIFKLVIKTALVYMTGDYSCKISNLGGTVSLPPRVCLTVIEPIAINSIELSPKEGKIRVGKSASLTVEVTGTSPTYKWFRNDSEEPLTDSAVYKDTTTATLHIEEATAELSGDYWCEVSNEISPKEKSSPVHLDVSMMSFSLSMTSDDVCLWLEQNGIPEEDVQKFKEDNIDGDTFITLPCDKGRLKDELKLTLGGANKVAKLLSEVQPHTPGPDHKEEKDDAHFPSESDIADTSELVEPITINGIKLAPEDGKIIAGKSASLTVEVTGTSPVYKWFRGGVSLTDSTVYKDTSKATLRIEEATTELSGNYWCEVSNEISPDKIVRSPSVHLDVMSDEQHKYLQKLDELMTAEDKIDIHYLKLYFIGMSGLGKTTFRKRLTKLYENILSLPPEERQRCSTYLAECTQVLAVISGSGLKLEVAEGHDKETQLLFQYLYTGKSESATLDNPPSENLSPNPITPTFSISKGVEVATDPLNETPVRDVKPKVIDHERISEIIQRLRGVVGSGSYHAKELLGKILLNLIDIGGQPGFLEMLPFLSGGPGMYLVFFPLDKELDEQYMVYYERDGKSILPYAAKYTVEETLSQILSAISSSHTTCNPIAQEWIGDRLEAFSKVQPLATLVGTFKDKIIRWIKKEQLKVMFPDASEKSIEAAVDSETDTQTSSDVENTDVDHATKQAISEELGSARFKEEVKNLVDAELAKKHDDLKGLVKDFDEVVMPADRERVFFAADNMHGKDSDIDPVRKHLNSVFNRNLKDAKLPIRPAQLLFGIVLRKEFHIITIDECYQIGDELSMDKNEVDFALWYLHHCVGALLYHPDIKDGDDPNSKDQDQSHKKESGGKSWFKNNVICSPQVVFDSISVLIVRSLLELHSFSTDTCFVDREQTNWTKKGQFSLDTIRRCYTDEIKKQVDDRLIIPVEKLIKVLKHTNLLSPISTKDKEGEEVIMYFMPAVLDCASKEYLLKHPQVDGNNPSPILFTFERGYVPIGLFCAMVTRLVSRGCEEILGKKWKLMDTVAERVKRNFVSFQIDAAQHEVTLISHVKCYELRISRKNDLTDLNKLCTYVLSTVQFVLKEIGKQVKPQVAFECLCEKHRPTEKRDLSNLCELREGTHPCFDSQDSQNNWLAKDAQLCRDTQLKVFPFADAQHLSDFTFTWKRDSVEKGTENELPIEKVTADDCTGYYCCEVSKNGTPYFTSYHSLKQCMKSFSDEMTCDDVCLWLEQNGIPKKDVQKFKDEEIDGGTFIELPCDKGELKQDYELTSGGANKIATLLSKVQPHKTGPENEEEKGKLSQPMKKHPSGSYGTDLQAGYQQFALQPGSQPNQYGNYQGQQTQFMGQNAPNVQPGFQPIQYGNYPGQRPQFMGQNVPNVQPNQYGNYQGQQNQFTGQSVPNVLPGFHPNQYGNNQGQQTQFNGQNVPNVQPGSQPNQYGNYQGQQGQFTGQSVPNFQPGFQPNQYGNYQGQQTQFTGQNVPNVQPRSQPNEYGNYQGQQGHQSNGSNADSVAGGPSGASGPTPNAQWIEPGGIPRLDRLRSFQLHDNKSIDIAQKIVLKIDLFATLLLEDDGTEMADIRGTVGPNPVNIVVAVLTQWLQRGSATWGSLVGTLRKTKLDALANQIESMYRAKNI